MLTPLDREAACATRTSRRTRRPRPCARSWKAAPRPRALAGAARRARHEGRAAGGDRRLRADDARARREAVARRPATCSTPAAPAATGRARSTSRRRRRSSWPRAACKVAKHGNRSVSSRCGSADVFERSASTSRRRRRSSSGRCTTPNIAFFFAPTFHPSMKHAAQTRRELGIRTAFNLLGPLTNPAGATRQIVGVPRSGADRAAGAGAAACSARSAPGSSTAPTASTRSRRPATRRCPNAATARVQHVLRAPAPTSASPKAAPADLKGGDAARTPRSCATVLDGERGPPRDVVLLNAGAALFVAGRAASVADGIARAAEAIDTGAARAHARRDGAQRRSDGGGRMSATPDLLRDDRRGDAADHRGAARARAAGGAASGARRDASPRGAGVRGRRSRATGAVNVIAECKRRSPSKGVLAADYDPVAIASAVRARRRGGDLGADRADVLRRRARASRRGARAPSTSRSCARTSSSTSTSCSRRARPAPTPSC